jgi:hypothetical protein
MASHPVYASSSAEWRVPASQICARRECAATAYFGTAGAAATDALPFEWSRVTGRAARGNGGPDGRIDRVADVHRDGRRDRFPSAPRLQSLRS